MSMATARAVANLALGFPYAIAVFLLAGVQVYECFFVHFRFSVTVYHIPAMT